MKFTYKFFLPLILLFVSCGADQEEIHPKQKDLTEAVYASGNLFPRNEYKVSANADGFLTERLVHPGDLIEAGDKLFVIEHDLQSERLTAMSGILQKARENVDESSPVLSESRKALRSAQEKMRFDSTQYIRYKTLWESGSTSRAQYDQANLAWQLSRNEYEMRSEALRRLRNQLYVELQQATNNYNQARKDVSNSTVLSNIRGKVYDVTREQGEAVRRNEVLAMVGDAEEFYLKLQVDELDIAKIKTGQIAWIKLDVQPGKLYQAVVRKIYPRFSREEQAFRVDAEFSGEKPPSLYGVTVEANIIIQEKKQVLSIPRSLVSKGDSVWIKTDGEPRRVHIVRGVESFDEVEVISGVTANDILLKP